MSTPRSRHLDAESEARSVQAVIESLADAMNRCDAAAFADHFTEDGEFTNVVGLYSKGREAIRKFHEPLFAPAPTPGLPSFRNALLSVRETRVRFLRPDVASVDARWVQMGAMDADGKPSPERRGLLNCVMLKDEGAWLIAVSHNMDLP
jgi:uncharacterized protein (TIGR02246 family)